MKKPIAITQPNFAPWIGCFEMIDRVRTFVFLDDVQYARKEWVNRNRIRSAKAQGWDWISVPVKRGGDLAQKICETAVSDHPGWADRMVKEITASYRDAPFFSRFAPEFFTLLHPGYASIADLNIAVITWGCRTFGIGTELRRASEFDEPGINEEKLIRILKRLEGDFYLANNGSAAYIQPPLFHDAGIEFEFQNYSLPSYPGFDPSVQPAFTFLDVLFRLGPEAGLKTIRTGRPTGALAR